MVDFDYQVYTLPYCNTLSWAGLGWVGVPGSFLSIVVVVVVVVIVITVTVTVAVVAVHFLSDAVASRRFGELLFEVFDVAPLLNRC